MKYSNLFNQLLTPQSQPIPGSGQVPNAAGGFSWDVDRWMLLDRFLILGSEGGTYHIGERKLTVGNAQNIVNLIKEDGKRVVNRVTEISEEGRAPKNDAAVFTLALATSLGNQETKTAAFAALPRVCRIPTHLFAFVETCEGFRGWGRGMRRAVGRWYNHRSVDSLTYALVKYQSRGGWSNRDLLRLAHPKPVSEEHKTLYKWVVDGELIGDAPLIQAILALRNAGSVDEASRLVREHKIPREAVPTELLNEALIWDALLADMPLTALVRNLGNLSKCGLLVNGSPAAHKVVEALGNAQRLKLSRLHPLALLSALVTYESGRGVKGHGEWIAVPAVVGALNDAFYASFQNVAKTGRRYVYGLDVSGSMVMTKVAGIAGLECRTATGALALVASAVEDQVTHLAFDTKVHPLTISKQQRLDDVVKVLSQTGGGGTDCAAPIEYATKRNIEADVFVILTDSETWQGRIHPAQAMQEYRRKMNINAKLVVVAMAANRSTIGDPADGGTLNVVGLDTTVPHVIADFARS